MVNLIYHETQAIKLEESMAPFIKKVGHIEFKHYLKKGKIDIYIGSPEKPDLTMSYASLCKFKDGKVGIVLKDNKQLFLNDNLYPCMYGAIAHELGHYINNDLDEKTIYQDFITRSIDKNLDKQDSFYWSEEDDKYLKTTAFATLKGGVITCELAADIVAVELVGLPAILMAHLYDDSNITNLTCLIENKNRINRLMHMVKENGLGMRGDSSVKLIFKK